MKLIIVGSDKEWAIERFFLKHFIELGVKAELFLAQSMFYDYYGKNVLNKLLFKFGLSGIHKKINKEFRKKVINSKPDVIFVFKGMEITPDTLKWLTLSGIKKVNFNPDNPFVFTGPGSGNKNVTNSIGLYDLHFTYNSAVKMEFEKSYDIPVKFLPFGFELDNSIYELIKEDKEIIKVCFLGNPDKDRIAFIRELAENNILIDIYGNDWKQSLNHKNITIHEPIYGNSFWKVLRKYRIQLNLMRVHNPNSHNMRSFEVPGVGGIMLAPDTEEHREFFIPDQEVFLFTDVQQCIRKIKYLLGLSKEEADKIRSNARAKSISGGYSYKDRAGQALKSIQELYNAGK